MPETDTARRRRENALVTIGEGYGNIVMTTPTIAAVRSLGCEVDVLIESRHRDAAALLSGWDAVETIFLGRDMLRKARRQHPYDVAVRTVWNRGRSLGLGLEVGPDDLPLRENHEIDVNLSAARRLGFEGPAPDTHAETELPLWPLPDRFVCVAPGWGGADRDAWRRKAWAHWAELCEPLHEQFGIDIILLGAAADEEDWMTSEETSWLHNLCGRTSIRGAAGIISRAEHLVAIDNGLAHIGASAGAHTTVLFGPTSEIKNAPRGNHVSVVVPRIPCRPCQMTDRWDRCEDWRCMERLRVSDVLDAVTDCMEATCTTTSAT